MSTIIEIEAAIEKLPRPQIDELADWLAQLRQTSTATAAIESWLKQATGAAKAGITTAQVMSISRADE